MKLVITSQVDTNVGLAVTGIIGNINANTDRLLTSGTSYCTLDFYVDDAAKISKKNKIFPVVLNSDDTIAAIVTSCTIQLTGPEIIGANLPTAIYNKVAAKLSADYGWTVVVA
jgi:hypothetical protein